MSDLKWNVDRVIEFLQIYKTYTCLWDTCDANYHKRDVRESAMSQLLEDLKLHGFGNVTKDVLKTKIKSLKDCYRIELNKVKKSMKSGAGTEDVYKPKLGWFGVADSFWRSTVMGRESSSNLDLSKLEFANRSEDSSTPHPEHLENVDSVASIKPDQVKNKKKRSPAKMGPPPVSRLAKFSKKAPTRFEKTVSQLKTIAEMSCTDQEDQHEKFGKFIAAQLREMPLRSVIVLQDSIQGLITNEMLRLLDEGISPSTPQSSFSRPLSANSSVSLYSGDQEEVLTDNNDSCSSAEGIMIVV